MLSLCSSLTLSEWLSHPLLRLCFCVSVSLQFSPNQHLLYCSMTVQDLCLGIWPRPPHSCSQIAFTLRLFPFTTSLTKLPAQQSWEITLMQCMENVVVSAFLCPASWVSSLPGPQSPSPNLQQCTHHSHVCLALCYLPSILLEGC